MREVLRRRRVRALVGAVVILALGWGGFIRPYGADPVEREELEKDVARLLLHKGVGTSSVSCPGDLEGHRGARATCTYTDDLSRQIGVIVDPRNPRPPLKGRVEVWVSDVDSTPIGPRIRHYVPVLDVRVIKRARRSPRGEAPPCPPRSQIPERLREAVEQVC